MSGLSLYDPLRWAPKDTIHDKFFAIVETGNTRELKLYLETHEINVNLLNDKDPYGWNALHLAAMKGNVEMMQLLLNKGAYVDERDSNTDGGGTALHHAAYYSHLSAVRLLVDYGARLDVYDGCEGLPLHTVLWHSDEIESKHREVVKLLIERGSDMFTPHKNSGETIFTQVAGLGDVELLQYLLAAGYDVNDRTAWGAGPALVEAAKRNRTEAVRFLIDSGATVDEDGMRCAYTIEMFDILRSHVDQELLETCGVLQAAAIGERRELVLHMLSIGMDLNDPSEMIKFMLSKGADVSLQDTATGDTALHKARHLSVVKVVEVLLQAPSDVHAINFAKRTPLASFAREMGNHYHYWQKGRENSEHPRLETLQMLIQAGSDVNAQDINGRTPLHDVFFNHSPNFRFEIPLTIAAASILIEAGARMDIPDNDGNTVRDLILAHEYTGLRVLLPKTCPATRSETLLCLL